MLSNKYLDIFLREMHGSETTVKDYARKIVKFFERRGVTDISQKDIREVTVSDANEYMNYLHSLGYANTYVNKHMKALYNFFKIMARRDFGVAEYNPFSTDEGAGRLKEEAFSKGIYITDENMQKLNNYFAGDRSIRGTRDYIIFLILVSTGIRRAEVCRIKIGDFFEYKDHFGLRYVGKGNKPLMTKIPFQLKMVIDEYIQRQCWDYTMKDQYIFPSNRKEGHCITEAQLHNILVDAVKELNLSQDISTHDFRHTYISKSIEMGSDIYDVSKRVGHASVATTKRYDHSNRIFENNPSDQILAELIQPKGRVLHLVG